MGYWSMLKEVLAFLAFFFTAIPWVAGGLAITVYLTVKVHWAFIFLLAPFILSLPLLGKIIGHYWDWADK